jgi:phosphatidylserine/phosphatidylglycerophosphate/cardiolipin synthase-like enzyme
LTWIGRAIVADIGHPGQQVLVGSQNFSVASLDYNRELGVLTRSPAAVAAVSSALAGDYAGAAPYSPAPAPGSAPSTQPATDPRHRTHGHRVRGQQARRDYSTRGNRQVTPSG